MFLDAQEAPLTPEKSGNDDSMFLKPAKRVITQEELDQTALDFLDHVEQSMEDEPILRAKMHRSAHLLTQ